MLILQNRWIIVHHIADTVGISIDLVKTILREHLLMSKVCMRWVAGMFDQKMKDCRCEVSNKYLKHIQLIWVAEGLFFCDVNDAPLLLHSLDQFPPNFPQTRVQVVARDTWFHIPEKFPLRDQICRKTLFKGTLFVISLRVTGNVLRHLHSFHPLVDIPRMCLS